MHNLPQLDDLFFHCKLESQRSVALIFSNCCARSFKHCRERCIEAVTSGVAKFVAAFDLQQPSFHVLEMRLSVILGHVLIHVAALLC